MTLDKYKTLAVMDRNDYTQKDVATRAGMSRGNFSTLINGRNAKPGVIEKVAIALGVEVKDIIKTEE